MGVGTGGECPASNSLIRWYGRGFAPPSLQGDKTVVVPFLPLQKTDELNAPCLYSIKSLSSWESHLASLGFVLFFVKQGSHVSLTGLFQLSHMILKHQ